MSVPAPRRSARARVVVATALVAALGAIVAAPATAGPVSEAARRRAEDAFVAGRPEDLDAILGTGTTPADLEPIVVRDAVWRPLPAGSLPEAPEDDGSLSARRIRWCLEAHAAGRTISSDYPRARPGETDPYPRLTALVLDRARREERGPTGLPDASPIAAVDDETLRWFVQWFYRPAFDPTHRAPDEAERADRARTAEVAARNRTLALASVGGLCLVCVVAGWGLSRRRKTPPAPTDP